jgi:hypothetical protein
MPPNAAATTVSTNPVTAAAANDVIAELLPML